MEERESTPLGRGRKGRKRAPERARGTCSETGAAVANEESAKVRLAPCSERVMWHMLERAAVANETSSKPHMGDDDE